MLAVREAVDVDAAAIESDATEGVLLNGGVDVLTDASSNKLNMLC